MEHGVSNQGFSGHDSKTHIETFPVGQIFCSCNEHTEKTLEPPPCFHLLGSGHQSHPWVAFTIWGLWATDAASLKSSCVLVIHSDLGGPKAQGQFNKLGFKR